MAPLALTGAIDLFPFNPQNPDAPAPLSVKEVNALIREENSNDAVLSIFLRYEDIRENAEKSLHSAKQKMNLSGFRKGKIPNSIAKKYVWEKIVKDEIEKKLIDNEVDIISGYRTNYPILNESINDKLKTLTLEACGITTVGDTLAAKDVLVNQRRSLVRSFVDATIAGWEYAIQEINEDETLDYVLKYMPHGSDRKYQKYCLLGITNMIGNDFPHEQHEHTWAEIKEFLIKYNLADKDVELFSCFAGY